MDRALAIKVFDTLAEKGVSPDTIKEKLAGKSQEEIMDFVNAAASRFGLTGPSLQERVESGEVKVVQDEQDVALQKQRREAEVAKLPPEMQQGIASGQAKFELDTEATPEIGAIEAGAIAAADMATGGLSGRAAAFGEQATVEDIEKVRKRAREDQPIASVVGDIAGFMLNPVRAGLAKTGLMASGLASSSIAKYVGANVLEGLAVEGTESVVDVVSAAMSNKGITKELLAKEGKELLAEGVGSAAGAAAMGVASPLVKESAKKTAKWASQKLANRAIKRMDPSNPARILMENAEIAVKENPEEYVKKVAGLFDEYKNSLKSTQQGLKVEAAQELSETAMLLNDSINKHTRTLLESVEKPQKSIEALTGLWDDVTVIEDAMSLKYSQLMDGVDKMTAGKVLDAARSSEILKGFVDAIEASGTGVFKNGKLEVVGASKYNQAIKFINEKLGKTGLTHSDLRELSQVAGRAYERSTTESGDQIAKGIHRNIKAALRDGDLWGREAADQGYAATVEYQDAKNAFKAIKTGVRKSASTVDIIKGAPLDLEAAVKSLDKELGKVAQGIDRLGSSKSYASIMPENLQQKAIIGIKATKEAVDYTRAQNVARSKKAIIKNFKGADPGENMEAVTDALLAYKKHNELMEVLEAQLESLPKVRKAALNPGSKSAVDEVMGDLDKYAKLLKPKTRELINTNAKYNRIANLTGSNKSVATSLKELDGLVSESDVVTTMIFRDLNDEGAKLLNSAKVMKALNDLKPSIMKTAKGRSGVDEEELLAAVLGPKAVGILMLVRLIKNPVALRLATEKFQKIGLTKAQQQLLLGGARLSAGMAAAYNEVDKEM